MEAANLKYAINGSQMNSTPEIVRFFTGYKLHTSMAGLVTAGALRHFSSLKKIQFGSDIKLRLNLNL